MSKSDIIGLMAKDRLVEECIEKMVHHPMDYDLQDLSQMIYEALLEQPEDRVQDLWTNNEMEYFVLGIIRRQVFSTTSPYYTIIKRFSVITDDIDECYEIDDTYKNTHERESNCE